MKWGKWKSTTWWCTQKNTVKDRNVSTKHMHKLHKFQLYFKQYIVKISASSPPHTLLGSFSPRSNEHDCQKFLGFVKWPCLSKYWHLLSMLLFWCNCQKFCHMWKTRVWHFILCSALKDAAHHPLDSTPDPRKDIFCSSQLLVLLGELRGALSALRHPTVSRQKWWHPYDLCVNMQAPSMHTLLWWTVVAKIDCKKGTAAPGGQMFQSHIGWPCFPLYSLLWYKLNPEHEHEHLNMSRRDI